LSFSTLLIKGSSKTRYKYFDGQSRSIFFPKKSVDFFPEKIDEKTAFLRPVFLPKSGYRVFGRFMAWGSQKDGGGGGRKWTHFFLRFFGKKVRAYFFFFLAPLEA
jgi:hypothetical protein